MYFFCTKHKKASNEKVQLDYFYHKYKREESIKKHVEILYHTNNIHTISHFSKE